MQVAAIYSRKSKYTEKGDSIENQITVCKEYLKTIGITEHLIYEDEGFSGKNIERPQFQRMLKDARNKKFSVLICYKLDRVSRNVSDFATFINELEKNGIGFISISEKFDTTSPMGRAMMYISSVFAQLERETIAQRIVDNMTELAKSGRWLGGMTPTGFESKKITYIDENLKTRCMHELSPIKEEIDLVKLIFKKYIETRSLSQVTKFLLVSNIKTKLNTEWTKNKVRAILNNPAYAKSSQEMISFFRSKKIQVVGEPDGIHGMFIYGKRKGKSGYNNMDKWIAAVSKHEGLIDGATWVKIQQTLNDNMKLGPRLGTTNIALLTGLIRCKQCGSRMRVHHGKVLKSTGEKMFWYACSMKFDSGCTRCKNNNLAGPMAEKVVINKLRELSVDKGLLIEKLKQYQRELASSTIKSEYENVRNNLRLLESSINNLVKNIALTENQETAQVLIGKLEEYTAEKKDLEIRLIDLEKTRNKLKDEEVNVDAIISSLNKFEKLIDACTFEEKKALLNSVIEKIYWDGSTGKLDVVLWGAG